MRTNKSKSHKSPAEHKAVDASSEKAAEAASTAREVIAAHPGATAATAAALVGAGVLAGVVAQRVLHHNPTVGEILLDSLKKKASQATSAVTKAASHGAQQVGARAKRALS